MTRFALIPLAFFANACASAEEAQEAMTDATEEVRNAFDEIEAEQDRSTAAYGSMVARVTERMFRKELSDAGCRFVAGVTGGWHNRSQKTSLNVFDTTGHRALELKGMMNWVDNSSGEILAKGHNASDNMTVVLEADWLNQKIDGDLIFTQEANKAYRFFGEKRNGLRGGRIIGAVGMCK